MTNQNNIFMFWNSGINEASLLCQLNSLNFKNIAKENDWNFYLLSLNKQDKFYVENFIDLPKYFFEINKKINDQKGIGGNQSDIIRLRLLEKYGGVYFDASTFLLKNKIEEIFLYKLFLKNKTDLSGYCNYTFTRKLPSGDNYFKYAQDGIELGAIFAKRNSSLLCEFNYEIDQYWRWKTYAKKYLSYPPFVKYKLKPISFLNEYHIHYSILHLILTRNKKLAKKITTQSIHVAGKEKSTRNGPYSITDKFCRGKNMYGSANPDKMLSFFTDDCISDYCKDFNFHDRENFINSMDLIIIPGYLRKKLKKKFDTKEKIFNNILFKKIYKKMQYDSIN